MAKTSKSKSSKKYSSSSDSDISPSSSPSSSSDDGTDLSSKRRRRRRNDYDSFPSDDDSGVERRGSRRRKDKEKSKSRKRKTSSKRDRDRGERKHSKRRKSRKKKRVSDSDDYLSSSDESDDDDYSEAQDVVRVLLREFPGVSDDLRQLLHMIDDGQAVDIKGISEKALMKHLKMLFVSLNLKEKGDRVFLLRSKARPTLEVIGPIIASHSESANQNTVDTLPSPAPGDTEEATHLPSGAPRPDVEAAAPRRRVIGPQMPSAELLAAAAKLTEAEAELREAEMDQGDGLFIGPPPPAIVTESESVNEAERFEEVTRIMGAEPDNLYDIVGVNHKMPGENLKKKYWKLSLMVHPDKCSHPQAHQAFIKLNKAFKELQDPDKRKALDDKIKKKEEEEKMKVEMRSMREAALWRRSQGLAMEGDDILLAELEVKAPPTRDEWMTSLPPERKPGGMPMQSTFFSRTGKEARGDTSVWTDTPSERAQKAKMNYLEAYNEAAALASNEEKKKAESSAVADLVDQYNKTKRSKTLVQKHQEEAQKSRSSKKSKKLRQSEEGEWVGNHPWKPWDREKDLSAGRLKVKLDADDMANGLASRFSSGSFQRSSL